MVEVVHQSDRLGPTPAQEQQQATEAVDHQAAQLAERPTDQVTGHAREERVLARDRRPGVQLAGEGAAGRPCTGLADDAYGERPPAGSFPREGAGRDGEWVGHGSKRTERSRGAV